MTPPKPPSNPNSGAVWLEDFLTWTPPSRTNDIISDGILITEGRLIIVGEPKSWKSAMALHTAYCIATGSKWFGYSTSPAAVFIYQTELPKAEYQKRVKKYMSNAIVGRPHKRIILKSHVALKLDTIHGLANLSTEIGDIKNEMEADHLVVILDPLYQLLSGDISNTRDMERLESHIDEIKDKFHCSFIIIHHTRKTHFSSDGEAIDAGSQEATGSSYLINWCDTAIKLNILNPLYKGGSSDLVRARFTETRNAERALGGFTIQWNRFTLQPEIVQLDQVHTEPEIDLDKLTVRLLDK